MRVALGILAGYAVMFVLVLALFLTYGLVLSLEPPAVDEPPQPSLLFMIVAAAWGLVSAVLGGYVATRVARATSWGPAGGLVAFSWMMGYASLIAADGQEPLWFTLSHFAVMLIGVLSDAYIRLRTAPVEAAA